MFLLLILEDFLTAKHITCPPFFEHSLLIYWRYMYLYSCHSPVSHTKKVIPETMQVHACTGDQGERKGNSTYVGYLRM